MPLQLIRRLSFRHRRNQENAEKNITETMRKASSCKGLLKNERAEDKPRLPDDLLLRIIDQCDAIEQIRMRAVCKTIKSHVDKKIKKITYLNVEKRDIDTASGRGWARHRHAQVSLKMRMNTARIVVDSRWTSRDVSTVVGAMSVYRKTILEATIDAPIAELVSFSSFLCIFLRSTLVVSLSALDLNRWYAFQCFMKAMDVFDEDMHMDCDFVNPGESASIALSPFRSRNSCARASQRVCARMPWVGPRLRLTFPVQKGVYWPNIQHLSVRTTEQQAPHLARVIDYGVQCNWVLDRRNLCRLRIIFTDLDASPSRKVSRHVYHFRHSAFTTCAYRFATAAHVDARARVACWAGSAGFDHRYEQQFAAKAQSVMI
ncbi:unnamed protein product [Cylicostephanus goldi]|uniref:F-box domain-containing protein n=1 Tax=Cylicostephanus goldi TaxID=71465 RepID=A0A3P7MWP0_CYLGO|nr:unnamed protein product [Cylicostephanus goldi]